MPNGFIQPSATSPVKTAHRRLIWSVVATMTCYLAVTAFMYFDRNNSISELIHSLGTSGVIGAILIMASVCMTPLPSEGLLIMYLKVYGVLWGTLYAWCGFTLGSVMVFLIARSLGIKAIRWWIAAEQFDSIDMWIGHKGIIGLLIVRLLPIPALVVNCITGVMPSVSFWSYLWTGVVGVIPYYAGISFIFFGLSRQDLLVFLVIPVLLMIGLLGYWGHRRGRY